MFLLLYIFFIIIVKLKQNIMSSLDSNSPLFSVVTKTIKRYINMKAAYGDWGGEGWRLERYTYLC